jgi:hypothetical protein
MNTTVIATAGTKYWKDNLEIVTNICKSSESGDLRASAIEEFMSYLQFDEIVERSGQNTAHSNTRFS